MWSALAVAFVGMIAAQAAPGPNSMAVAAVALSHGRRPALLVVGGIATGVVIWSLATAFGLGQLFRAVPQALTVLMFAGGAYLVLLAVRSLLALRRGERPDVPVPERAPLGAWAAWRRGLLVVLTNPKAALMWSAMGTFLFGAGLPQAGVASFGLVAAGSAGCIYGAYGLMFSSRLAGNLYGRFRRIVEVVFSTAFGCLGLGLLFAGVRALRP